MLAQLLVFLPLHLADHLQPRDALNAVAVQ